MKLAHLVRFGFIALALLLTVLFIGPAAGVRAQEGEPAANDPAASQPQAPTAALGTSFTYQGRLNDGATPANGAYDFQFKLFDAASAGAQVGATASINDLPVSGGSFTTAPDFGASAFGGQARWLEVAVRPGASTGGYTTLTPRRALLASPYAMYSNATRGMNVIANGTAMEFTGLGKDFVIAFGGGGVLLVSHRSDLWITTDSPNDVVINPLQVGSGKVGIGTESPQAQLHVEGENDSGLMVSALGKLTRISLYVAGSGGNDYGQLDLGGNTRLRGRNMPSSFEGAVGIGTTAPRAALEVAGGAMLGTTGTNASLSDHVIVMSSGGVPWQGGLILTNSPTPAGATRGFKMSTSYTHGTLSGLRISEVLLNAPNTTLYDYLSLNSGNVGIGTTDPKAKLDVAGATRTDVLQIDAGADLAEPFAIVGLHKPEPGLVVAIDPDHIGQLRVADRAYDRTVAGVISGAGGLQPGLTMQQPEIVQGETHPVALTGRVYVWADASFGAIQLGDLLTTSATPGHAMRVGDYDQAQGAILGKAMSRLEEGKGLVLVLVSLQ